MTFQIVAGLAEVFEAAGTVGYPRPFKHLIEAVSAVFTIDVVRLLHVDCIRRATIRDTLLLYTVGPFVVGVIDSLYQLGRKLVMGASFFSGGAFKL